MAATTGPFSRHAKVTSRVDPAIVPRRFELPREIAPNRPDTVSHSASVRHTAVSPNRLSVKRCFETPSD
jgi:hypothetical protein